MAHNAIKGIGYCNGDGRKREVSPLFGAGRKLGCEKLTLVTDHERETVIEGPQTIEVVSAQDWLNG